MFNALLTAEEGAGFSFDTVVNTVIDWVMKVGVKIVVAIVVLLVSFKIINWLGRKIEKKGEDAKHDKTLMRTLAYVLKLVLKVVVAVCMVSYVGIDTSGITALIASFGVCFGLAVNGAVANIAGGVLILVTRPFRVDDFIEAQGVSGTVEDIHMVCTKIRTPDNKVIYLPNGALSNGNIINYSEKDTRRVDFSFSIAYANDFEKAKNIVSDILYSHELTLKEPEPMVRVGEHGSSSINITARVWVKSEDYWTVHFDVMEAVKLAFDSNGIEIPFDQLDVHIKQQ